MRLVVMQPRRTKVRGPRWRAETDLLPRSYRRVGVFPRLQVVRPTFVPALMSPLGGAKSKLGYSFSYSSIHGRVSGHELDLLGIPEAIRDCTGVRLWIFPLRD